MSAGDQWREGERHETRVLIVDAAGRRVLTLTCEIGERIEQRHIDLVVAAPKLRHALLRLKRESNNFAEWAPRWNAVIDEIDAALAEADGCSA